MDMLPGTRIRDYEIVRLIGSGGMGEVWLARELMLDREVAIKRLNVQLTRDTEFSARFQNEARIQARLNHPNIVGMHAFFEEGGQYYMVLEYAPGITLRELIDRTGPIPEQRTLKIFQQIAAALTYAHAKGIIHRDVKPSNIMVDPDNQDHVKIMDFGIARLLSEGHLTRTGTRLGTMHYMSPEQVLAEKDIDARSDVYSSGVVLYEMLSGRLPFNADTDSEYVIQHKIVTEEVPDPRNIYPHISEAAVALLRSFTRKQRSERAGLDALFTAEVHPPRPEPKPPRPEPEPPRPEPKPPRPEPEPQPSQYNSHKKAWLIGGSILLAALLAWLVMPRLFVRQNNEPEPQPQNEMVLFARQADPEPEPEPQPPNLSPVEMVLVEGGSFLMGSNDGDSDEQPVHQVTLSPFYIGKYEVTQKEWMELMGSNPSYFKGDNLPVEKVSWFDAVDYCNKRSVKEGLTPCYSGSGDNISCDWGANGYRLPTEAEWEHAARGGNGSNGYTHSGSNDIGSVAWYDGNSGGRTHNVGGKSSNELGLHDMSGNVWEWCWDWYGGSYYQISPGVNPRGPGSDSSRLLRGGSWGSYYGYNCRVASRFYYDPGYRNSGVGFRLARAIP